MRVLVACEFSGIVRDAFAARGHDAWSCDILPTERPGNHIQGDVREVLNNGWDLMVGHPPCTYISYAGTHVWNNPGRVYDRLDALRFFADLWEAPIEKICLENPKGCASPTIAKYTQEIQPFYFGDPFFKTTWLWLKNLPPLVHNKESGLFDHATHTHTHPNQFMWTTRREPNAATIRKQSKTRMNGQDSGQESPQQWRPNGANANGEHPQEETHGDAGENMDRAASDNLIWYVSSIGN